MKKLFLTLIFCIAAKAACPPACADGTQLKLDVSKNTVVVTNTGSVGGAQTVTCDSKTGEICKIRFYMGGSYTYIAAGGDVTCPDPCAYSINTQYGRVSYLMVVRNSADNTTLRTSSRSYLAFTAKAAVTTFPVPEPIHGFKDYTSYHQFNIPNGADISGGLRIWVRSFNLRQGYGAVISNDGTEHILQATHLTKLTSDGTTCTGTSRGPHGLTINDLIQINQINMVFGGPPQFPTNGVALLNATWTVASTPTANTFTFTCNVASGTDYTGINTSHLGGQWLGYDNSATVSKGVFFWDEMKWYGGLDNRPTTIRMMVPVANSEFTVNANNTIGLRFKDNPDSSLYDLAHGWYGDFELVNGPDLTISQLVVSGNTATATITGGTIPASWTTGDTVVITDAPGPQWRFNDRRTITTIDTTHFSFTIGPTVDNWSESGDTVGVSPFTTTAATYTIPTSHDTTTVPSPIMKVAHCLIPKSSYTGASDPVTVTLGGNASAGQTVYTNTILRDPNTAIPNNLSIATCQSSRCHTEGVKTISDMKYFGFTEYVEAVAGMRRGLSETDAINLAAFLTSNVVTRPTHGRPWNPPFQPAPDLDTNPIQNWSAGGGEQWRLTYDNDIAEWLVPGGTPGAGDDWSGGSYTNWGIDGILSLHTVPVHFQLPHWMQYLPRMSPLDFYTDFLQSGNFTTDALDTNYQTYLNSMTQVTLTGNITNVATSIPVSDASKIANNDFIQFASGEYAKVTAGGSVGGATNLTVTRNQAPCTNCSAVGASAQSSGTFVSDFTVYTANGQFVNSIPLFTGTSFKSKYQPEFMSTGGRTQAGYWWPSQYGKHTFDMYGWVVSRTWELTQTFWLQNMLDQVYRSINGVPNGRAPAQYTRGIYSQVVFNWGPHKSVGGTQQFETIGYCEDNFSRYTAQAYHLSALLDAGNGFTEGNLQQDMPYYSLFNIGIGLRRPASYMYFMGSAFLFQNGEAWPLLINNAGADTRNITMLRLNFALGYGGGLYNGEDLFMPEARKGEILGVIATKTLALLNEFSAGTWQTFITTNTGSADLSKASPSRTSALNGSTFYSDSFALALAGMHFYSVDGTTLTNIATAVNAIFTGGHDFTTDITATCTYTGTPPRLACP